METGKTKIAFYDACSYDKESFSEQNKNFLFSIDFFDFHLTEKTALTAAGYDVVCTFVNDTLNKAVIATLKKCGVKMIALRCAGFNNVDLDSAREAGIKIARVPSYSPHSVAEHALAILLALTRKIPQAYLRTRSGNFMLSGLTGRDLNGLTAGVIGTGKIGKVMAECLAGIGMNIIMYDAYPDNEWADQKGFKYIPLIELFQKSDVITLHCPLTDDTKHLINENSLAMMKNDAVIINTGRGALIDSHALVKALKKRTIGGAALDVYEEESRYFFADWSADVIKDDMLSRLLSFPNVIITGHQAFLTTNALKAIADTTLQNIKDFTEKRESKNTLV
ncbi:2-hydroxyacid dehydrogenase [Treponema sp.]|uniref:2-hydroxyacid dehydrogenase n=1 Tax=Treponema sp. TaxID=166 RepID=UPI003F129D95